MHVIQRSLISYESFLAEGDDNHRLVKVLGSLDAEALLSKLNKERNRRRDKYPYRMLWNTVIAAKVYGIATIAGLVRELSRNPALRELCGVKHIPKAYHYSRFVGKLAKPENRELLLKIFHGAVSELSKLLPDLGESVAVDGTAVSSYCNRFAKDKSDKEAGWGVRKRKLDDGSEEKKLWYGYSLMLAVDTKYELPIGFEVIPANMNESPRLPELLREVKERHQDMKMDYVVADAGFDSKSNCRFVLNKLKGLPIIKMRLTQDKDKEFTGAICRCNELGTPICSCDLFMIYAGRDGKYLKFRCPKHKELRGGPCSDSTYGRVLKVAISEDERRWPGLARQSKKWERLYKRRTAVERVNSRLKEHLQLDEQYVRGLGKITVNATLSLLVMVGAALAMAKEQRWKDMRRVVRLAA
jgi:transposase, IS5 family